MLALAPVVAAEERAVTVVVRSEGDDAVVLGIRSELEGMGLAVIETEEHGELGALAKAYGARAAIGVRQGGQEVEVWTGEGVVDVIALRGGEESEALGVGVGEALRARGVGGEGETSTSTNATTSATTTTTTKATTNATTTTTTTTSASASATTSTSTSTSTGTERRTVWGELGAGGMGSAGGLGVEVMGLLGARLEVGTWGSIAGFGSVPLWRDDVRGEEGVASASTWLLGAAFDGRLSFERFEITAGVGIASAIVVMDGQAQAPFEGREEVDVVPAPIARAAGHLDLGGVRVVLRVLAGVSMPRIEMQFDQREVAHWGQPFVAFSLGAELPLAAL